MGLEKERHLTSSSKAGWGIQIRCILLGYCLFLTTFTLIKTMGIFFVHLQTDFGASAAQASFTISLPSAVVFIGGPAYGAVFNSVGIKPTYALAGGLMFLGFAVCFFAPNLFCIQMVMGIVAGMGAGLANVTTLTLMGRAFYTSRPAAMAALAMAGSTATAVGGPVIQWWVDSFTWRGAILLLGAYCLHGVAFGIAIEPVYKETVRKREQALVVRVLTASTKRDSHQEDTDRASGHRPSIQNDVFEPKEEGELFKCDEANSPLFVRKKRQGRRKSSVYERFSSLKLNFASVFDVNLLKNPWFVCYCLSCGLSITSRILSGLYLVRYAQAMGINDQDAAMKLTVCESVAFAVTPIIGGITSVKRKTSQQEENRVILWLRRVCSFARRSYILSFFQILLAVVIAVSTVVTNNEGFIVYAAMLGFCYGGITFMTNVVLVDMFGTEQLAGAVGYRSLATGILFLGTPPLIGYLIDIHGTYKVAQYFTSFMTLIAGILTSVTQTALLYKERTENNNNGKNHLR